MFTKQSDTHCNTAKAATLHLLKNIVQDYLHVIENKNLSTNTNKSKLNAWLQITERFNAANVRKRDKKQLMNQWKLAKINCKKQMSQLRRELNKTGGGPKPPSPSPEVLEIAEMIPLELEVDYNEFDSDAVKESVVTQNVEVEDFNYPSTSFGIKHHDIEEARMAKSIPTPKRATNKTLV
ncbi:unnamed protein product [Diabrotica balteata]|uniref:Regulatory protein zeste n=1 Tax=Diabrotica balteata TaxID=107213 RepID=A0A9N9T3E5_DIABA|nr:unnamed protein product [Diabrotica balteata]